MRTRYCWHCDDEVEVAEGRCWECCNVLGIPILTSTAGVPVATPQANAATATDGWPTPADDLPTGRTA